MGFKVYNSGRDMERCVYRGKKPYIFISYAHADSSRVFPIIETLHENGYRVWYDEGIDPGTEWPEFIAERISSCGYFIAFISDKSINSENCKDEMNFARDLGKERLLVYLEDVELPPGMQMRLNRLQAVFHHKYDREEQFYDRMFKTAGLGNCMYENGASSAPAKEPAPKSAPAPSAPSAAASNASGGTASKINFAGMDIAKNLLEQTRARANNSVVSGGAKINPATATPVGGIVQEEYKTSIVSAKTTDIKSNTDAKVIRIRMNVGDAVKKGDWILITEHMKMENDINAPVDGIISAIYVNEGDTIEENGLLVTISETGYKPPVNSSVETIESLSKPGDPDNIFDMVAVANKLYSSQNEQDLSEAARLYKIADFMGSKSAAANLGNCYYYGKGVSQDYKEAVRLYKIAADKGDIPGTAYLGMCYYRGKGVSQDYKEAVRLYKIAAEKKNRFSLAELGNCYRHGHGVPQDMETAFDYYWDAAELGNAYARAEVANCYRYGRGCVVDLERAKEHYKIAADMGNKFAADQLKALSGE